MAFTDYGSESLVELIRIHKENLDSSSGDIGGSIVRPVRFAAVANLMWAAWAASTKLMREECHFFLLRGGRGFRPLRNGLGAVAPLGG